MKKFLSVLLSTAMLVTMCAQGVLAEDTLKFLSLEAGKFPVEISNENVQKLDFEDYTTLDTDLLPDAEGVAGSDFYANNYKGAVSSTTYTNGDNSLMVKKDSDENQYLELTSANNAFFPVVKVTKAVGNNIGYGNEKNIPHQADKKLSVSMDLYFDADSAIGYKLKSDNKENGSWENWQVANFGFVSLLGNENNAKNRITSPMATIAYDTSKTSTWDGTGSIPAAVYLNNGVWGINASGTGANYTSVNLPIGKWFKVKFVVDVNSIDKVNHTVPIEVYVDGTKVAIKNPTIDLTQIANYGANYSSDKTQIEYPFENYYQSIAFNPQSFYHANNCATKAGVMKVDNISADYVVEKAVEEDFSTYQASETNLLVGDGTKVTDKGKILDGDFYNMIYSSTNVTDLDTAQSVTNNKVQISNDPKTGASNTCLKLTSDVNSAFPILHMFKGMGVEPNKWQSDSAVDHEASKQLVISSDLFFDKATALNYKLTGNTSYTAEVRSLGIMSVMNVNEWATNRNAAVATLGFDTSRMSDWTDNKYIPVYINVRGIHDDKYAIDSPNNLGYRNATFDIATDEWVNVKFVFDIDSKKTVGTKTTMNMQVMINDKTEYSGEVVLNDIVGKNPDGTDRYLTGGDNSFFGREYNGIVFSPLAYAAGAINTTSPSMYIDNVSVEYAATEEGVKFGIKNTAAEDVTSDLILAGYDTDKGFINCKILKQETIPVGTSKYIIPKADIEVNGKVIDSYKVFAWDSFENMAPLADLYPPAGE